ncbi:hypothetical protein CFP65_3876 [Kitasatospora sp. MMS16-BH015]|nr:hypothetical protein CFP65_3876 [Kitasatospora sp. MMS16-BH015]
MTIDSPAGGHRHRGRRDGAGPVVTGIWVLANLATVLLLGASAAHQLDSDDFGPARASRSAPDHNPPAS